MTNPRKPRAFVVPNASANAQKASADKKAEKPDQKPATTKTRKPRAVPASPKIVYNNTDEFSFAQQELETLDAVEAPPMQERLGRKRTGFSALVWAAISFLIFASIGLWVENLVTELAAQNLWLGRAALVATAIFVAGILFFVLKEILCIWKLRSIAKLKTKIVAALEDKNNKSINTVAHELESHFASHPKTAHGRAVLDQNKNEVMDALDRFALTEAELMRGLDREARQIVMNAAKRISVVTAVSPRALVDVGYVLFENIRLIRVLSQHYGGRTGFAGTISLTKNVVAHLAVTGSIAVGDGIIQQLLGHGLAARLSARLGEGVVNGLMTVRVGIAAIDVCRPSPFVNLPRPRVSDFAGHLLKSASNEEQKDG